MIDFYNTLRVSSYGAIFNEIKGARNLGKTTAFACRSVKRFIRKGSTTLWLRRFENEARNTRGKLFKPKILDIAGIPRKSFKWDGYNAQIEVKGKFRTFLKVAKLSDWAALRSADDGTTETIVFDEFATTPERYARYRGNEVENLIDLAVSMKREHNCRVFMLGNKEYLADPYTTYFGVEPPEPEFRGIRTYKNGSFLIEINDDIPDEIQAAYAGKWDNLLKGTKYGEYLFNGATKGQSGNIWSLPKGATRLYQFDFAAPVTAFYANGNIYLKSTIDKSRFIFVDMPRNYARQQVIRPSDKFYFTGLISAYKTGLVKFCDEYAIMNSQKLFQILGLK